MEEAIFSVMAELLGFPLVPPLAGHDGQNESVINGSFN